MKALIIAIATLMSVASIASVADARNNDNNNGNHRGWGHEQQSNHHWQRGERMGYNNWQNAQRIDYRQHHLRAPPRGYEWRQSNGDYVLAAVATGVIASIILSNAR